MRTPLFEPAFLFYLLLVTIDDVTILVTHPKIEVVRYLVLIA